MGAIPVSALNIVGFPTGKFSMDILTEILMGGLSVLKKAGAHLLGGHTVEDNELKYGLAVTGLVHPDNIIKNRGIKDNDVIVLTKPVGTGIISTALKANITKKEILDPFITSMNTLNKTASEIIKKYSISACTDLTGFGLIGHIKEMLGDDNYKILINSEQIPLLPGAAEYASMGMIPGGMYRNRKYIGDLCMINADVSQEISDIIFDPQTSGGLLISLKKGDSEKLLSEMHSTGIVEAKIIAEVKSSTKQEIIVV